MSSLLSPSRIGLGGRQLGVRMLLAAIDMGLAVAIIDAEPDLCQR